MTRTHNNSLRYIAHLLNYLNPLRSKSDQHQISPHHISPLSHIKLMKIREIITKDERFSKQVLNKHMEASKENLYNGTAP